jgi:hypothetical protein
MKEREEEKLFAGRAGYLNPIRGGGLKNEN